MVIPCAFIVGFMSVNGGRLFYDCRKGNYVIIVGECVEIEKSKIFKRVKSVRLNISEGRLRIPVRGKLNRVEIGSKITLYVATRTATYFYQGEYGLHDYYAMEIDLVKPV